MLRETNKWLGHSSGDHTIPLYVRLPPVRPASIRCQATHSPFLDVKNLERYRGLGDSTYCGAEISSIPLTAPGLWRAPDERDALWALSDGRLWGLSWHLGTPHVRGRLSPRGSTRGPIETRSKMRKTPRSQLFDSCLTLRRHGTCGRRATNSSSSQSAILCSTSINVLLSLDGR